MQSLIEKIRQGKFSDFPGGVHPPQRKTLSNQTPIAKLPLPQRLYVTIKQHIGVEGHLEVRPGDMVLKGQPLTKSMNPFAVPVHAPTSGEVTTIAPHVSAHPSGLAEMTIEIRPDGKDEWIALAPLQDYQNQPKLKVIERICHAGISGMGGAGFPTHIKVSPKKNVEFLVVNGVECEPYISSDDRLMREHAWQIRQGIDVITHLLNPKHVLIAIEDNKPEALHAMQVACQENPDYVVCSIPTKYPAGGEKQLIQVLTGREVPNGGLPIDVGIMMQNVGTCFAIADAIFTGKPLIQRVVTLSGECFDKPGNVWALLGTPVSHLLQQGQYQPKRQRSRQLIMGGPMMGFNLVSDQVPVVKITNCILAPTEREMVQADEEQPCIRCSACADACPASLLPQQIFWHAKAKELDKAGEYNLFDCIECGACAYVCPSQIPLVHYYRVAKAEIRLQEEEKHQADKARERFEARKLRLEQEKAEREEKHRQAAEARRKALEQQESTTGNKVSAAVARAKARQQTQAAKEETPASDKVAAAVARAKARKARQEQESTSRDKVEPGEESKQDKVASAIARAKAKKAKQENASTAPDQAESPTGEQQTKASAGLNQTRESGAEPSEKQPAGDMAPSKDTKAARVAAAVARAKARKAAADQDKDQKLSPAPESASPTVALEVDEEKKQRVAAAIARAKAKKRVGVSSTDKQQDKSKS
ncbi:electron transport complex subunit RsxC [Bowmanella dokdonensis]|uniref:electron transport complex subunit RsxC n=1 Tax=Bowmanella dokdonensis TaxID=751969 RepID=UPI001F49D42A|nr:electron transport complex subunit RsxC [Bowmanella dokdonensis]